jgi:hypothetical protein
VERSAKRTTGKIHQAARLIRKIHDSARGVRVEAMIDAGLVKIIRGRE